MFFYFAYGSNMSRRQMTERCPDHECLGIAVLKDHALCFPRTSPVRNCGVAGLAEAQESLNRDVLICTMIETEEAIANVDEIAKVPGIDVIMIGSTDLTTRMGIPGQWGHEKVQSAYKKVGAACKKNGKHLGLGGIGDDVWAPHYIKGGARMVLAHSDHGMIMEAGTNRAKMLRGLEKKGKK